MISFTNFEFDTNQLRSISLKKDLSGFDWYTVIIEVKDDYIDENQEAKVEDWLNENLVDWYSEHQITTLSSVQYIFNFKNKADAVSFALMFKE